MTQSHRKLGELLLEAKVITPDQLNTALSHQRREGKLLGTLLVRLGFCSESAILNTLKSQLGLPSVDLETARIDERAIAMVKEELAKKHQAMPVEITGRTLVVAVADPLNVSALEDLRFQSGLFVRPVLATPSAIQNAIARHYGIDQSISEVIKGIIGSDDDVVISSVKAEETPKPADELLKEAEGRPIVRLTNWLLSRAVEAGASDIHIEPQYDDLLVRIRVDGLLQELQRLPKWTQGALVSRIKVLSELDIAEKRKPQDGRLRAEIGTRRVDMRVSTLPVTYGEKTVIRVIDSARSPTELASFGFQENDYLRYQSFLDRPQGIVVVTGPTGSGKTSLLYSSLRYLQDETKNIVTVEDPVEYQLAGINQVQVDEKAKKTFPLALRAILRQDPDVIMIGEIRDKETAQIAFRASVTGHLVLSTVHTNDTAGAVTRLVDLGLEPFMVASSLVGLVSVRLVRVLCPHCREEYMAGPVDLERLGRRAGAHESMRLYRAVGCPKCNQSGYRGRTGIFEVLGINDSIRTLIVRRSTDSVIRHAAVEQGMRTIGHDGLRKVIKGVTTLEEVSRVVYLAEQAACICPTCSFILSQEFEFCPSCGGLVGENCRVCRRRLQTDWNYCPFCGEADRGESAGGRRAEIERAA